MERKIIAIDKARCNGCGACAAACHEGAIGMVGGKAQLLREDYCDGLGDCLPACPTGAITFVRREAAAYDQAAVEAAMKEKRAAGCPGRQARAIAREDHTRQAAVDEQPSRLAQWPVQIQLAPVNAPYFEGAHLLIAADCTAYACAGFHERFMKGKITLVGCPKLDGVDYAQRLGQIVKAHWIQSLTLARMEVPCCGGLEYALERALASSGKDIPWRVWVISTDGRVLEERSH